MELEFRFDAWPRRLGSLGFLHVPDSKKAQGACEREKMTRIFLCPIEPHSSIII